MSSTISETASEQGVAACTFLDSQSWRSIFREPGRRENSVLMTTGDVCQGQGLDATKWLERVPRKDGEYKGEREARQYTEERSIKSLPKSTH